MYTKYKFMQRVGVIDVPAITAREPTWDWDWWNYGNHILFWGKKDWERAIGIIYKFVEGSGVFDIFGCGFPANPPAFEECILFTDRDNQYIDEQDDDICMRALGELPRAAGRLDGMVIQPSTPGPWTQISEHLAPVDAVQYSRPPIQIATIEPMSTAESTAGAIITGGFLCAAIVGLAFAFT